MNLSEISDSLHQASDGIWYCDTAISISYPDDGNESCHAVEDGSFWFSHRNECITAVVDAFPPSDKGPIFDIGGGNGYVAAGLQERGHPVVVVEPGPTGAQNARKRGLEFVVCATTKSAGFKDNSLPAIGLFDVIEHIENDVEFINQMHALLKPGGRIYATVPAYSFLWSGEDEEAGHFRRYSLTNFREMLGDSGFQIEYATYIFRYLPVPIFLLRSLPFKLRACKYSRSRESLGRDHVLRNGLTSQILSHALRAEVNAVRKLQERGFGASCLIVATKGSCPLSREPAICGRR